MTERTHGRVTISMDEEHLKALERIALNAGYTWGEKGNVSAMFRAVAEGNAAIIHEECPEYVTYMVSPSDHKALAAMAKAFGYVWGDKGHVPGVLRAIAAGRMCVGMIGTESEAKRMKEECKEGFIDYDPLDNLQVIPF